MARARGPVDDRQAIAVVRPRGSAAHEAWLEYRGRRIAATVGEAGIRTDKVEGDRATPAGVFAIRRVLFRADRLARPVLPPGMPSEPIAPSDGWCDDVAHADYNRAVVLAQPGRAALPAQLGQEAVHAQLGQEAVQAQLGQEAVHAHRGRAEPLWREDGLYDLVAVLGVNDAPVVRGRGSAVFLHVARPDGGPTEGCVGIDRADLLELLATGLAALDVRTG